MGEPMTLIERLRNPAWESDGLPAEGKPAKLNVAQTCSAMDAAAREIDTLRADLAEIERATWTEGKAYQKMLMKCRKIASRAAANAAPLVFTHKTLRGREPAREM